MLPQQEPERRVVIAEDGVRLSVSLLGEGFPTLLIAGLGGKGSFWTEALPHVAAGRRIILPDHRGCGASDRPVAGYSIGRLAADMLCILDALGIARVDIVGHSTGGLIAQRLALSAPGRVRDLVLSGTWNRPDAHFRHTFETRLAVLQAAGPMIYSQLTAALGYPPDWFDEPARVTAEGFESAARDLLPLEVSVARLRMLLDYQGLPDSELAEIGGRILVLGAIDDAIVPFCHQLRLHEALSQSELREFSGGHFFPRSRAKLFADAVTVFLAENFRS
jgi:aminoacrylate hydrolase